MQSGPLSPSLDKSHDILINLWGHLEVMLANNIKKRPPAAYYMDLAGLSESFIWEEGLFASIQQQSHLPIPPPKSGTPFLSSISSEGMQRISCFLIFKPRFFFS